MATKSKRPQVDRARPVVRTPAKSDADRVKFAQRLATTMPASPNWGQAVDVHPALDRVTKGAAALAANTATIAELKSKLLDAVGTQRALRRDMAVSLRALQSAIEVFAAGRVDVVNGFGFEVVGHTPSTPLAAPFDLTVNPGKLSGELAVSWKKGQARYGFIVQHATDPANQATYSAIAPCTRTKTTLGGLPSGTSVHVRVAAVDPTQASGMSPWSNWYSGTVR